MAKVGKILTDIDRTGYIYAIKNQAWVGFIKIGRAVDVKKRLGTYNTGDPFRGYRLLHHVWVADRFAAESWMKKVLRASLWGGEWYEIDDDTIIRALENHCADSINMPYLAR